MKNFLTLILALSMMLTMAACGGTDTIVEDEETEATYVTTIEEVDLETDEVEVEEDADEADESEAEEEAEEVEEEEAEAETLSYTVTPQDDTVMYAVRTTDVRSQPDISGTVIATVTKGEEVTVTGVCDENGWYQVAYGDDEVEGYISASALSEDAPVTTTAEQTSASTDTSSTSGSSSSSGDKSSSSTSTTSSKSSDSSSGSSSSSSSSTNTSSSSSSTSSSTGSVVSSSSSEKTVVDTYTESDGTVITTYSDGTSSSNYSCGVSWHQCISAAKHTYSERMLSIGCPHCGCNDLSCGYFYWGSDGSISINSTGCSKYDITKDEMYYCQTCGKKVGNGTGGTCAKYLYDGTCDYCGGERYALVCHSCS